jgi:hypothetical protein
MRTRTMKARAICAIALVACAACSLPKGRPPDAEAAKDKSAVPEKDAASADDAGEFGASAVHFYEDAEAPNGGNYLKKSCSAAAQCRTGANGGALPACVDSTSSYCACIKGVSTLCKSGSGFCVWQIDHDAGQCACVPGDIVPCGGAGGVRTCGSDGKSWTRCTVP